MQALRAIGVAAAGDEFDHAGIALHCAVAHLQAQPSDWEQFEIARR